MSKKHISTISTKVTKVEKLYQMAIDSPDLNLYSIEIDRKLPKDFKPIMIIKDNKNGRKN